MAKRPDLKLSIDRNRLPELMAAVPDRAGQVVMRHAFETQGRVRVSFTGAKHGRTYTLRSGKSHTASAPGEPPAILTGQLTGSLFVKQTGPATAIVGTNDPKAEKLERGQTGVKKRPFMKPAADAARPGFEAAMGELVQGF